MNTLKDILSQFGYITQPQLATLVDYFPQTKVIIKWGGMPRERLSAWQVAERIAYVEENDIDYCREVFLTADQTTKLKEVFAIAD
tara:strand:- start:370 stop:624 length:255 start_codon:yes stop_codon:yes gene_type:complete